MLPFDVDTITRVHYRSEALSKLAYCYGNSRENQFFLIETTFYPRFGIVNTNGDDIVEKDTL